MTDLDPARLVVQTARGRREFDQERVVVGREQTCDLVVDDPRASRHHLTFERQGASWYAVDASSGGTFVAGRRIGREPLHAGATVLHLGDPQGEAVQAWQTVPVPPVAPTPPPYVPPTPPPYRASAQAPPPVPTAPQQPSQPTPPPYVATPPPRAGQAPVVAQQVVPPGQLTHGRTMMPAHAVPGGSVTIGRDLSNDVVLDDPLVSRFHARLQLGRPAVVHDLGSFNGVFVNGHRVVGAAALEPGHEVIVGNQTFRWDGAQLLSSATQHEFTLYADGLTVVVDGGRLLLENVSCTLAPSSLTAVIGPSGAGKSTLLGALTGLRPATHGRVVWQGHDLYAHYDQLRFQIGLVPQQDIQHPQLKVRQALAYAAELRLPPDTRPQERDQRVRTVAGQLQLQERLDNRIGSQLSGGQRKRVSIATELLTAPPLLFLDEPTSGLDPGLDLEVMRQLRTLADEGRVVVVVTHSVLALDVCDNVMVLAPGGRTAYFGPPSGVLDHFGVASYPEVFDRLDEPDLWSRIAAPRPSTETAALRATAAPVPVAPRQSFGKQLSTLVRRNLAVVVADRLLLTMLLALPLVLGLLSRLVPGGDGLSLESSLVCPPGGSLDACTVDLAFSPAESLQRLIVLIVAACLMGTALAIRELVGERSIFRREYAVGLSPGVYFASKIIVLGSAAFVQGLVVTFIAVVGLPGPDGSLGGVRLALVIGLLATSMVVAGLTLSAVVTSTEQTMPALVGMIMVQLVLSASLFQIHGRPLLAQVAWLAPSRWAYAAAGSAMGLDRSGDDRFSGDPLLGGGGHFVLAVLVLLLLTALTTVLGYLLVRRSATSDR
ncbi:ATP-binding cassette domain-containing protein [Nocardioides plantarum]|uniref:ATP-binding cassette domain-containing protein n=1 Tax=Nocardioides plantarum TaxID=29299 RepID=A0ABV5K7D2_9ACTN|nr:ATP-binding cassette domain-containing protein [Nocardioides plantarum]